MRMTSKVSIVLTEIFCFCALSPSNASDYCTTSEVGTICVPRPQPVPHGGNGVYRPRGRNDDPPDWDPRMCSYFSFKWCAKGEKCTNDDTCIPMGDKYYGNGHHCPATDYFDSRDGTCTPFEDARVCLDGKSSCGIGEACVANGTACIPKNSPQYCGDRSSCDLGRVCTKDKECLWTSDVRVCPNGQSYCREGEACVKNGTDCVPIESRRYCGNRHSCKPGWVCAYNNKGCRPEDSTECDDNQYCPKGQMCTADRADKCLSLSSIRVCSNGKYCEKGAICTAENSCIPSASLSDELDKLRKTFDGLRNALHRLDAGRSMTRAERADWSKAIGEASTDGWKQAFNLLTSGFVLNRLAETVEDISGVEAQLSDADDAIESAIDKLSGATDPDRREQLHAAIKLLYRERHIIDLTGESIEISKKGIETITAGQEIGGIVVSDEKPLTKELQLLYMLLEHHFPKAELLMIATDSVYDGVVEAVVLFELSRLNDVTNQDLRTLEQIKQKMDTTQADILKVKAALQALQ